MFWWGTPPKGTIIFPPNEDRSRVPAKVWKVDSTPFKGNFWSPKKGGEKHAPCETHFKIRKSNPFRKLRPKKPVRKNCKGK